MIKLISSWSNYMFIVMAVIYAISCFTVFLPSTSSRQVARMNRQETFMFIFHFVCYGVLFAFTRDTQILILYMAQAAFFKILIFIYQHVYPDCSRIMMNHMCFLMIIGFVMLSRIGVQTYAIKQFIIAAVSSLIVLVIPVFVEKAVWLKRLRWLYGIFGLCFLMSVKVIGRTINGSTNWIAFGPIQLQPMEFVKITYIFFIAAMLGKRPDFKRMIMTSLFCAAHVVVLILENDLGGALLYFTVFVLMAYVATGRLVYLFGGAGAGTVAGWLAYMLRAHVRTRFTVWKNPWEDANGKGYQITQSLFALGAGGWFGTGLTQGVPNVIPVVASDFIFAAIVEELGLIFSICLILIYIGIFVHFLRIAMDLEDRFYKLIGYGFSVCFIFQVFLSIGGVTKFIPSTGVTLPLISYGGSSVASTLIIFGIMQGMFMIAYKEDAERDYNRSREEWMENTGRDNQEYIEGFREGYRNDPPSEIDRNRSVGGSEDSGRIRLPNDPVSGTGPYASAAGLQPAPRLAVNRDEEGGRRREKKRKRDDYFKSSPKL